MVAAGRLLRTCLRQPQRFFGLPFIFSLELFLVLMLHGLISIAITSIMVLDPLQHAESRLAGEVVDVRLYSVAKLRSS